MTILEASWEVCNKQGGIYTVLSTRARAMMDEHQGQVVFVGPLRDTLPPDFIEGSPEFLEPWVERGQGAFPLPTAVGRWAIPGEPPVILVDFSPLWAERGAIYYDMWQAYGLESDKGYGDYDENSLFAVAAARLMLSLVDVLRPKRRNYMAIFNEWQTAMGLLYLKHCRANIPTMFITHASTVGRSIAGNGKELYAHMPYYYGDQMAQELSVEAKHAVEKRAAHCADIFATVSRLTATECTQLIGREPLVLPNGFEGDFVPKGRLCEQQRKRARARLAEVARLLTGLEVTERDMFISLGGRYEYRNKGIDLYVESIARLRKIYKGRRRIIAFILVPAWVAEPRADLRYLMSQGGLGTPEATGYPLQHATLTHWLHNMDEDIAQNHIRCLGLNEVDERVNIIQVPVYLTGEDGIMNMAYYDLLSGMDLTVYPSYYEPWGYTPLESIAFGVPTITTRFAGFGLWAEEEQGDRPLHDDGLSPVVVLNRRDDNALEMIGRIAELIEAYTKAKTARAKELRAEAQALAHQAEWQYFYKHYTDAYKRIKPQRAE